MKSGNDSTSVLSVFIMQCGICCMKQRMCLLTFKEAWTHYSFCRRNNWWYYHCSEAIAPHCLTSAVLQHSKLSLNGSSSATKPCHTTHPTHTPWQGSCRERSAGGFSQPFNRVCFSPFPGYSNKWHFEALQVTAPRMTSQFCVEMDRSCN